MAEDLPSFLKDLVSWALSKSPQQTNTKQQPTSTSSKITTWLVVSCVVVLALGILYAYLWIRGRKLAKLQHERDVAAEASIQAQEALKNGILIKDIQVTQDDVKKHEENVAGIDAKIASLNANKDDINDKIQKLRSWNDLDNFMSGDKPS